MIDPNISETPVLLPSASEFWRAIIALIFLLSPTPFSLDAMRKFIVVSSLTI